MRTSWTPSTCRRTRSTSTRSPEACWFTAIVRPDSEPKPEPRSTASGCALPLEYEWRDGTRRVTHVSEVMGMEGDVIVLQDLYLFDYGMGMDEDGKFLGHLKSTGIRPHNSERLANNGISLDSSLFSRDGVLVRPKVYDEPPKSESPDSSCSRRIIGWKRPAGTTALVPASIAYVRTRITAGCRLTRPGQGCSPCPDYLSSGIHAAPTGIREVRGLALGPILRPDGTLLNSAGYDQD